MEDVDIVWNGESLHRLLSDHGVNEIDCFISSHNLEHTVDLIDHLQGIQSALKPEGLVCLTLPDLPYTFDFFYNPSTVADALRTHRLKCSRHPSKFYLINGLTKYTITTNRYGIQQKGLQTHIFLNQLIRLGKHMLMIRITITI